MAEETALVNEDFSDAQTLDIAGDDVSEAEQKFTQLSKKIVDLEKQKQDLVDWTKALNAEVELLKKSLEKTGVEKDVLKREIENLESEKRSLHAVAARVAELESKLSRQQHDLVSALSDVQKLNNEVDGWKTKAEGLESVVKAKTDEVDAARKERDTVLVKVTNSETKHIEYQHQINFLEKKVGEKNVLEKDLAEAKRLEKELLDKVEFLEVKLKDVESLNVDLKVKQLAGNGIPNGGESVAVESSNRASVTGGGLKIDSRLVVASTVGAVGVAGILCYLHATKKQ